MCWSAYGRNGVLFIRRVWRTTKRDSMRSCSSTIYCLALASTDYYSTSPPQGPVQSALCRLLINQPSTGSCSSSPPARVCLAAASIGAMFIQRQRPLLPGGSCSSNPHRELFIQTPNNAHCSSREGGSRVRSASVSSSSEGITQVQLTARARSLGFSNVASATVRVQLEPNASLGFS